MTLRALRLFRRATTTAAGTPTARTTQPTRPNRSTQRVADVPATAPTATSSAVHAADAAALAARNRRYGSPVTPARGGTSGRTRPTHFPAITPRAPALASA